VASLSWPRTEEHEGIPGHLSFSGMLLHLVYESARPNKPLKLTAEQCSPIDPGRCSGFPGVGRPW